MKNFSLAHICAYFSLAISITMLVLWCCNVGGFNVVSLDTFVGVIVTLLTIAVTLAIAWQIFNSVELKNKIEELNVLKDRLNKQEKKNKEQTYYMSHLIYGGLADVEISRKNYILAFSYLMKVLENTMSLEEPMNINVVFTRMKLSVSKIAKDSILSFRNKKNIQYSDKIIRESRGYNMIESQYEKIFNDFFSKVKDAKNE